MINFVIDEAGIVKVPNIHDSKVLALKSDGANVSIDFKLTTGDLITCVLRNVEQFVCNGFRKGNIVLDMTVTDGEKLCNDVQNKLLGQPPIISEKFLSYVDGINQRLIDKKLKLVVVNPSYGCECVCLCGEFSFYINP